MLITHIFKYKLENRFPLIPEEDRYGKRPRGVGGGMLVSSVHTLYTHSSGGGGVWVGESGRPHFPEGKTAKMLVI